MAREKLGKQIASNVEVFVPDADAPALRAVAQHVDEHRGSLRPETVVRVASAQPIPRDLVLRLLDKAVPAAEALQIVEVFNVLGGEYAKVSQPGAKLVVRHDDLHGRLLTTLKASGVIESFGKKRGRDLYGATVT